MYICSPRNISARAECQNTASHKDPSHATDSLAETIEPRHVTQRCDTINDSDYFPITSLLPFSTRVYDKGWVITFTERLSIRFGQLTSPKDRH